MADAEHMRQLVACCFHSTILYLPGNLGSELSHGSLAKVRVVSGIALYADPPALLGHAKHKGPALFRIQVGVRQHQQTLVLLQANVFLQVVKQLAGVKLPHPGIWPHP